MVAAKISLFDSFYRNFADVHRNQCYVSKYNFDSRRPTLELRHYHQTQCAKLAIVASTGENMKVQVLEMALIRVKKIYEIRGFSARVIFLCAQIKFYKQRNNLGATASIVVRGEHVK